MNTFEPARATHKAHGRPTTGTYFGYGTEPREGVPAVFTVGRSGVTVVDLNGEKIDSFGTATKFWYEPAAESTPEAQDSTKAQPEAPEQPETQAEAPKPEKAKKSLPATPAARRIPEQAANRKRQAYVEEVGMARYRNQYNAGWDAATAGQGAKKAASGDASVGWMDGYTDRVANPGKEGIANKWAALRSTKGPVTKVAAPKEG